MRRFIVSVSLALVVLLGLVATMGRSSNAQEAFATPGPGEFEIAPGQILRFLATALVPEPPAGPLELGLLRVTADPGSVFTGGADDPSAGPGLWLFAAPLGRRGGVRCGWRPGSRWF